MFNDWLIETNTFFIDEYILTLNTDWMSKEQLAVYQSFL